MGHEIDYTILDYVADLRAPTPSAAAELCVPDRRRMQEEICSLRENIQKNIQHSLQVCYNTLSTARPEQALRRMNARLADRRSQLSGCAGQLMRAGHDLARRKAADLGAVAGLASSLNPYAVLSRGYAMVEDAGGRCLTVPQLKAGDRITLRGSGAAADCTVNQVNQAEETP